MIPAAYMFRSLKYVSQIFVLVGVWEGAPDPEPLLGIQEGKRGKWMFFSSSGGSLRALIHSARGLEVSQIHCDLKAYN